jgi:hypothetical protein
MGTEEKISNVTIFSSVPVRILLIFHFYPTLISMKDLIVSAGGILWLRRYRLQGEKLIVDGVSDTVEPRLELIEKFMKPPRDDFADLGVVHLCGYTA